MLSSALLLVVLLSGFVAALLLVPLARRVGLRFGIHARASADRWHQHETPVPKSGGLAMVGALVVVVVLACRLGPIWQLLLLSGSMFAIGLADDIRPVRPATKLVCQLLAASVFIYLVGPVAVTKIPPLDMILTFAWIVGITNAFNLLDNIDGLASGIAMISTGFFVVLLLLRDPLSSHDLALLATAMVGVTGGFLFFNLHPASVFMGDSGSHLLGSFIAGATLLGTPHLATPLGSVTIVPVVILLIPILDTAFVTLTRSLSGRSAFIGGRDHLSHRLVALGLGDGRAVIVLYALAVAGGFVAVGIQAVSAPAAWALAISYLVALGATGVYLAHIHVGEHGRPAALGAPLPSEVTNRYRVYEVMLDAVLLGLGYYCAFLARFRGPELSGFLPYFYRSLPIVIGLQLAPLWMSGKYRQVWRVLGPAELFNLARGLLLGVAASIIALLYLSRFEGYSRSVFLVDAVTAPTFVIGARVALGAIDHYLRLRRRSNSRAAVIIGAGRGGVLALHELLQNAELDLRPVGFIDDDPHKRRQRIEGVPVLGPRSDLANILQRQKIICAVVSIRDLPRAAFDEICLTCREQGVEVRRMRFSLEDVEWRDHPSGVVRFPGA
jgi:UDP-GlcNAc:undecaprenyl-phosphate GlcNAc-1-phosphate transferase